MCLGNTLKDCSVNNMIKTGLNGYVYNFSVDYNTIDTSNIIDIHKYLIKKHGIKSLDLFKNVYWNNKRMCNRKF